MDDHTYVMATLQVPDSSQEADHEADAGHDPAAVLPGVEGPEALACASQVWRTVEERMPWFASIRAVPDSHT